MRRVVFILRNFDTKTDTGKSGVLDSFYDYFSFSNNTYDTIYFLKCTDLI